MTRLPRRLLLLLAALGMIAAACGGDSSSSGTADDAADDTTETTERQIPTAENVDAAGTTVTAPPLGDRGPEPSGSLVFSWHTAFSPAWLDPQDNPAFITPYAFGYIMHDALMRHMPDEPFALSLADSYSINEDYTQATFTLREGLTFHDGSPLTTEDVKFSYENYSGANSDLFQAKTESVEIVSDTEIVFNFNEPFLDFITLYGSAASGAGWIVPSDYYQDVGPEGFVQNPIGAGPFKFVENKDDAELVFEAFPDYWRKNPGLEEFRVRFITDAATRFAALQTGEIDLANVLPGSLYDAIVAEDSIELVPVAAVPFWLEFTGWQDPESPFNDIRVREAISLAIDRDAITDAEFRGAGATTGQWIPRDLTGTLQIDDNVTNIERAQELMAEAGYEDGIDAGQFTPLPPYFSLAERVMADLADIGITTTLNQMERGAFLEAIGSGEDDAIPGIIMNISGAPGDAANRIRSYATCDGASSRICVPEVDESFLAYEASTDAEERTELLDETQQYIVDNHIFPFVIELALFMAQGEKVGAPGSEVWAQIPQYVYPGPYEDLTVAE